MDLSEATESFGCGSQIVCDGVLSESEATVLQADEFESLQDAIEWRSQIASDSPAARNADCLKM
jgi:hypothetical protein